MMLTLLMAKAMNRSISNILFTNFGAVVEQMQGEIKGSLKAVEASDAKMEEGSMRVDANVSVRLPGQPLGTRSARVFTDARSEPEFGSLMPSAKKHSPRAIAGR